MTCACDIDSDERPARLGAIELVELGRGTTSMGGSARGLPQEIFPFPMASRRRDMLLGQAAAAAGAAVGGGGGIADFFGNILSTGFGVISDIVKAPLNLLMQGSDLVFGGLAKILMNIPILGEIVAALLLVVNAVIKTVLSIPGFILDQLTKAFGGLSKSFGSAFSPGDQADKLLKAKSDVVSRAPEPIRKDVAQTLSGTALPDTAPADDTAVIVVGAAAAAAVAAVLLV